MKFLKNSGILPKLFAQSPWSFVEMIFTSIYVKDSYMIPH